MKCDELKVYHCNEQHNEYTEFHLKSDVDAAIDELKAEINHKEGVGLRWFERCMEARTENVKLKRALWLSRAELCCRLDVDRYLRKHINSWYNENCLTWAEACVAMEVKMCKAESKCRAKAEEYK